MLHVEAGAHLYGGALQVCYLLRGLHARGWESALACTRGSAIAAAASDHARVMPLTMRGEHDVATFWRLRTLIRALAPDIVHIHSRRGVDLWGGLAGSSLGVPIILSRRVDNPEPFWLVSRKYRMFDRVVTVSDAIRRGLAAQGVPANRIVVVRSAVDGATYQPANTAGWLHREFGLPDGAVTIGMIAQFIPRKGHHTLLKAAARMNAAAPEVRFLLFGQGKGEADVRQAVAMLGLQDRVIFAGFRADLDRVIPALDMVVHPAEMEGLGVSLLQAAASGVPVVATNAGGIGEVVRHDETGLLVATGDHAGLADALIALALDRDRRARLGRNARSLAEREFTAEAMVDRHIDIYRSVLKERDGPSRDQDAHRAAA